jgi:AraC-like DNA-binding protein
MSPERLGEWCSLRLGYLKSLDKKEWTLAKLEQKSGVSEATINRIFKGDLGDRKLSYITAVIRVLVNGTWGQYPCILGSEVDMETIKNAKRTAEECSQLRAAQKETADHIQFLRQQILEKDKQIASKDERLAERRDFIYRKDRIIAILSVLLGIFVLSTIGLIFF